MLRATGHARMVTPRDFKSRALFASNEGLTASDKPSAARVPRETERRDHKIRDGRRQSAIADVASSSL